MSNRRKRREYTTEFKLQIIQHYNYEAQRIDLIRTYEYQAKIKKS